MKTIYKDFEIVVKLDAMGMKEHHYTWIIFHKDGEALDESENSDITFPTEEEALEHAKEWIDEFNRQD